MISGELSTLLCVLLPLFAALAIFGLSRWPNGREAVSLLTGIIVFSLVWGQWDGVASGARPTWLIVKMLPGVDFSLQIEPLGLLFALIASFLWIVTTVYSIGYMRGHREENQTRFYACFALAISSALGVAFSANLLTMFVFYEMLTLSTYPLVTHSGTDEARRAGRIYLGVLIGSSIALQLIAIVWTWAVAGTAEFTVGGVLTEKMSDGAAGLLLALYVFGIGKAAIMPFHRWLPAAMVAPTPVSALLHAVAVVKAGVFCVLKVVVYIFGIEFLQTLPAAHWLVYVAAFTIIAGSLIAMTKDNLKLRLAYSTVSQLSYILLGALLANTWAVLGAVLHILMHAFAKITLFFCAGIFMVAEHKTQVSQLKGLGRRMPITMTAFLIASLSLIGFPLLGGMWSKWYIVTGTLEREQWILLSVLLVSSLLNVAYLASVPIRGFFANGALIPRDEAGYWGGVREAPMGCLLAIIITASGCLFLFWNVGSVLSLLKGALVLS